MENVENKTFGIAIIESLKADDRKTGTFICEEVLKSVRFKHLNINTYFYSVNNRIEFFDVLYNIIDKIRNDEYIPILQIETHGYEDGIELSSSEIITWEEVIAETRKINILLKNKLALFICACEGNSIIGSIDPSQRAPFRFLISSFKKRYPVEILDAFTEFYNSIFSAVPIAECIQLMNKVIAADKTLFNCITSSQCFDSMVDLNRDVNNYNRFLNQIANVEKASNTEYKDVEFAIVSQKVEKKVKLMVKDLENMRGYFEMTDLQ
jgi:hypothetical protein